MRRPARPATRLKLIPAMGHWKEKNLNDADGERRGNGCKGGRGCNMSREAEAALPLRPSAPIPAMPPYLAFNCGVTPKMRTIMVVDDVPDARDVLARLLRMGGYSTVTAEDGVEALAALTYTTPDL